MRAKKSTKRKAASSSPYAKLISDTDQRRINEIQLLESESNRLSARLQNLAELKQELESSGEDSNCTIQQLRKRRSEIAGRLSKASKDTRYFSNLNLVNDHFNITRNRVFDVLGPWSVLNLPTMSEGISEAPVPTPNTTGEITTAGLFQGTGAFVGIPQNSGSQEQWWIHTWKCLAVLPPAPYTDTVSYRFAGTIDALVPYGSGQGTLRAFVTIGTTSDVNKPITNWQTVGWPVDTTLPQPGRSEFAGKVPVVGTIGVGRGQIAAVGIIFGVAVSVACGYVFLGPNSNFGAGLIGKPAGPDVWGKIEYRFNPPWLTQFVQEALAR